MKILEGIWQSLSDIFTPKESKVKTTNTMTWLSTPVYMSSEDPYLLGEHYYIQAQLERIKDRDRSISSSIIILSLILFLFFFFKN